jgi:2-methylaconitate cis-trans-isomerase PrpF
MQKAIPCTLMRGGTSRGPYFLRHDLPEDRDAMGRVLLAAMGSPDARQIDGLGGATTLTSKVCIVSRAAAGEAQQVDYLFAQVLHFICTDQVQNPHRSVAAIAHAIYTL